MKYIVFSLLFLLSIKLDAQDPNAIIEKSQKAITSIQTCRYLIYGKYRVTGMRDTLYHTGKCRFNIEKSDTLLGRYISAENFNGVTEVYNGTVYFKSRKTDSTVYIWNASEYNFYRHQFNTNPIVYSPLFNRKNIFSQLANDKDTEHALLADTLVFSDSCYHIKTKTAKLKGNAQSGITIFTDLFIRKKDYMPLGHVQLLQSSAGSINNFESFFLDELVINSPIDENTYAIQSTPINYTFKQQDLINIKNYIVSKEQIPDFDWQLLQAEKVINDVTHKNFMVVILKNSSYFPCNALLDYLSNNYFKNSIQWPQIIFISDEHDNLKKHKLISSNKSTFIEISNASSIIQKSNITTFPTIYLFDQSGRQVDKFEGFGLPVQLELEEALQKLNSK